MYTLFRQTSQRLLRIPHDPSPPPGDESSTRIFRAASNYYKYLLFLWGLRTGLVLIFLTAFMLGPTIVASFAVSRHNAAVPVVLWIIEIPVFFLFIISSLFHLAVLRLDFEKRWYVVTDRSLRIREGVVAVREMTVTFANIQNISISQGPIQRILHIADLRVDTAGGGGGVQKGHQPMQNLHTAFFRGVDNANEIRELIQQRLNRLKDAGLGDHEDRSIATSTPAPVITPALSRDLLTVLREIHHETAAMRQTLSGNS